MSNRTRAALAFLCEDEQDHLQLTSLDLSIERLNCKKETESERAANYCNK